MSGTVSSLSILEALPFWPAELFPVEGDEEGLSRVKVTDFNIEETAQQTTLQLSVQISEELVFHIPGLEGISLVLAGNGQTSNFTIEIDVEDPFAVRIVNLSVGLRFSSSLFRPAKLNSKGQFEEERSAEGEPLPYQIDITGTVRVSADGDFEVVFPSGAPAIALKPVMIGGTGVVIEADQVQFCFDRKQTPPDPVLPAGWRGVFIGSAAVHFSGSLAEALPSDLQLSGCYIGTGGFTGDVSVLWSPPFDGNLLGSKLQLERFEIGFVQNTIVSSSIEGAMTLPFFDQPVGVDISIGVDGGLAVALSATQPSGVAANNGLITFEKTNLLRMSLDSIRFELDAGVFTAKLSGQITPLVGKDKGLKWPTFDVQELGINSKGEVWVEGGWIALPRAYTLNLHLFKLEITKFGIGRTDDGRKFLGFSGGLDLVKGIPAGASVEGLRITFDDDFQNISLSMKGVGVEFSIPGTLDFKGAVSYDEPGPDLRSFAGELELNLPTIDLKLDAVVVFGSDLDKKTNKRFKYFGLYVDGEFGTGIPLLNTGIALKGIAALFSMNYAPDKPDDWMWYSMDQSKSWFHRPKKGVTDLVGKWAPEPGTLGLGAGVLLATASDNGYLFNGKFLLLFLFPGPVIMLDGRCDFLKKATGKSDAQEPMFHSLVVLDTNAGYFLIGLDAKWKYDAESGKLVEIAGSAEAYFNYMDPRLWHIYIGKKPLEQRIRASFAGAFEANAYFMLDGQSLDLGVWIGKNEHYQFGPVGADLEAWLDATAVLSFRPAQLAAGLWLHGLFRVKVFKFKFAIGLDARLSAQVAKPFHILGTLTITIETRLKDFEIELRLEWGPRPERPEVALPFKGGGIAHLKSTVEWQLDGSDLPALPSSTLDRVPVDGRPWLTFEHPVHDLSGVSVNPAPDPGPILIGNRSTNEGSAYVHYTLSNVAIDRDDNGTWTELPQLYGSWAAGPPNPGAGGAAANQNRLMLYAKTPFDMTDESDSWNPWISTNLPNYPCPIVDDVRVCIDWGFFAKKTVDSPWKDAAHPEIELRWDDGTHPMEAAPHPIDGHEYGILFRPNRPQAAAMAFVVDNNGTLSVIDTATDKVDGAPIAVRKFLFRGAITPDGRKIILTGDDAVVRFDVATRSVDALPIVHKGALSVAMHPDGSRVYVTSHLIKSIAVIDLAAWKLKKEVALNDISAAATVLFNGRRAYVTRHGTLQVSAIETSGDTLAETINVGLSRLWDIVATPDSATLFIPGGEDRVAVLNATTHRFEAPITVQKEPMAVAMSADGTRLWVANATSNSVSVVDVAKRTVIATVPVGTRPRCVALTADGKKAYVTNSHANSVTVIDAVTHQVIGAPIAVGLTPEWIVIAPVHPGGGISLASEQRAFFPGGSTVGGAVEITVPAGASSVEVLVYTQSGATITAHVSEPAGFETLEVTGSGPLLTIDAAALKIHKGIRRVVVACDRDWILLRVCYVRPDLEHGLGDLNALHEQLTNGVSVWGAPGAVFEPYRNYRVRAKVKRDITGIGKLSDWQPPTDTYERYWFFETAGPPGLATYTTPRGVDAEKGALGPTDLTRYVAQTVPPTLTPEGERPRLRRPVFRSYDIGADFNEDYVDRMYELAGRDLAVQIYDSVDNPVRTVSGDLAVLANPWGDAATVQLTETRRRWLEVLDTATCMPHIDHDSIPRNKTIAAADHVLGPDTLYEARLVPLLLRAAGPTDGTAGWMSSTFQSLLPVLLFVDADRAPQTWTDVFVRFELQPTPTGLNGVAFRVSASGGYVFTVDVPIGRRSLMRVVNGAVIRLGESMFAFESTKSYHFAIEAIGPRLRVVQDGEVVFDVSDGSTSDAAVATHPAGTIALFPLVDPARLIDLAVHDFRKGAPVAYRFQMTTSAYVDFHHQIHSFQDEAWRATPAAPIDLASTVVRVTDPKSEVTEQERRAYETLADALLRSAARQLPERLEATRLEQNDELQALLVRCDEPVDWSRTDLTLQRLDGEPGQSVVPGTMKLTRGAFDWMQLAGDVVEVLLREPMDPSGARVEALLLPKTILDPAGPPLFVDRFADGDFTGWTVADELPNVSTSVSSESHLVGSELQLINTITAAGDPAFLGTFAAAGSASWTDIVLSATVRSPNGGAVGLVVRGTGIDDYYRFSMDSQQSYRQLVKKVGGVFTVLWRDAAAYDPFAQHDLTFVAAGGSLRGYLNGIAMFAVDDDDHQSGIIACYVAQNEAYFSNVRVDPTSRVARELALEERFDTTLDRWTFTEDGAVAADWTVAGDALVAPAVGAASVASAFAGDLTWTDYRLTVRMQVGASGATDVVFRAAAADRFLALRFDADASEMRLLDVTAAAETVVWTMPWTPMPLHEHLVTIDCLNTGITLFIDGMPIHGVTTDEVSAGRIGLRVRGTTGTTFREVSVVAAVWSPWHTFDNEKMLDAGTRIEIYGSSFDIALPALTPGTIRRLAPAGTRRPKLPLTADLRIIDPDGKVQHARRFIPGISFEPLIDFDLMRSADGTGFFILPRTATAFAKGTYRLAFAYHRNQPGVTPVLSRAGSLASEFASIDVPWTPVA